ncbi:MAG: hypothetical protein RJA83_359 [Pseudomonadota bacterium]|jgi:septal ring factor EnvC (AmiA/AmiB activator)
MTHEKARQLDNENNLAVFLQQTLGVLAESYMVSVAELSCLKEEKYKNEQLSLKQDLLAKDRALFSVEEQLRKNDNELAALSKKLEEAEADLMLANTKIKDMEDAVSKLLSKVAIPNAMIKYMVISTQQMECLERWGCREGGLIKPDNYDVLKSNSVWLGWRINGFLMARLKNEGDFVLSEERVAKYVDLG